MPLCPSNCADFDLTDVKNDACEITYRDATIRSIGFYPCDTVLPMPLTAAALTELAAPATGKPKIVFSNELVNAQFSDPTTEEIKLSDSRPALEEIASRELTFDDRIAVNVGVGTDVVFKDYDFWKNKKDHAMQLNYVIVYNDGRIVVPREKNSARGMAASFSVFLNSENQNNKFIEIKRGKIRFLGDPLDFVTPDVNLNDIPELAGKW